jgi:aspartyl-tRNA(Asn)/glutamyl-tRNA(Gln) amidotransferase subunit B
VLSQKTIDKYKLTVGIECHVQLNTKTKLFAAVGNDARQAEPNTLISHICLGMPGALPVLNEQVVEHAMRVAFAFNTEPQKYSYFERKHYFYPDLPKGYQITQLEQPIIKGGFVDIKVAGKNKRVNLNRVQIEEDAGKTSHPANKDYSLVDLNRAGTPLLEIVSEPDITSSAEAKAYARELWLTMRYAGVSDADLYHGNMRFDVNVSVSKDPTKLGLRTETKNLNSFKSVEKAVDYEFHRQVELLEKGKTITQETRGWDDAKQKTFSQRSKEDAHDYRYFPDPDIPPIMLSDTAIDEVRKHMPALPKELRGKLAKLNLDESAIETLLDEMPAGSLIIELLERGTSLELIKKITNWLVSDLQGIVYGGELTWDDLNLVPEQFIELAEMTQSGKLSSTAAKAVLEEMVISGDDPAIIAEAKNLLQVSDESAVEQIVEQVIAANTAAAEDVKKGEMKAIGFLVGQVMKASQGKANPALAQKIIKKLLGL